MARFYPNAQSASTPQSEKRVFEALKKLGDDWVVVHGLRFVAPAHGKRPPRNGEADFVLIHPRYGLIVLEAKGGRYEVERGDWYTYPGGQRVPMDSSPFDQATRNRYDLAEHLFQQTAIRGLRMGHAVAFTDSAPRGNLGPAAPSAIVVDGTELTDLPAAVRRICAHWFPASSRGLSDPELEQVLSTLAPTASITADRRYAIDVTLIDVQQRTEREIEWTGEQLDVIAATEPGAFVSVLGAAWHREDDHRRAPCRRARGRRLAGGIRRRPAIPAQLPAGTAHATAPEHRGRHSGRGSRASSARTFRRRDRLPALGSLHGGR